MLVAILSAGIIPISQFAAADSDKNFPILTGTGAPSNKLGHDGNLYIDNSNHNYYQKIICMLIQIP